VQFVDEQNHLALRVLHLLQKRLETVFKFTAEFRPRDHGGNVHRDEFFVFQRLRNIPRNNAPGQSLGNRGLARAGLADEHGIVLRTAREDLHHAADLGIAADYGVDASALRKRRQIAAVFFERLIFALRVLVHHTLGAAHLLESGQKGWSRRTQRREDPRRAALGLGEREQVMLGAQVFVAHFRHVLFGGFEHHHDIAAELRGDPGALNGRAPLELLLQPADDVIDRQSDLLEKRTRHPLGLLHKREQNVIVIEFRVPPLRGVVLGGLKGLLKFFGESIWSHTLTSNAGSLPHPFDCVFQSNPKDSTKNKRAFWHTCVWHFLPKRAF
jgi:hypothetical protein